MSSIMSKFFRTPIFSPLRWQIQMSNIAQFIKLSKQYIEIPGLTQTSSTTKRHKIEMLASLLVTQLL